MKEFLNWLTEFFGNPYVRHLESEIDHLRGQNARLQIKLEEALSPKPAPAPVARQFPQFTPPQTSWEAYRAADMKRQEEEDQADGTHSSGR